MTKDSQKLFNRPGYISLQDYVEDIQEMKRYGPWKLPLGSLDYLHFLFLSFVLKISWFKDILYIYHTSKISPSYKIIFSFLEKNLFFDSMSEGDLHCRGFFSYHLQKTITIKDRSWVIIGQGVSENRDIALSKALGEIVERMVSGLYDMNRKIINESVLDLVKKYQVVYPPKYHRFLDIQKNKQKSLNHLSSEKIPWVEGYNLITKEKTYIPRQITSWFDQNYKTKHYFINPTTNGAAGYFTKDGAILRGLLEVVQRDAFFVHWLTTTAPHIIEQETLPEKIKERIKNFELLGISLYLLDVTDIPIPSVFIVATNSQSKVPQIVLTGASSLTFEEAINDGLREMVMACEMFFYKNSEIESKYEKNEPEPFISNIGKIGRQLYWKGEIRVKEFNWFVSGAKVSYNELCKQNLLSEDDDSNKLKKCLEVLGKLDIGYHPVVYFPENKIQKQLGFYIAQVFIPKAFPLYLVEKHGTFDSDRLEEFALSKNNKEWKLNTLPHMFS